MLTIRPGYEEGVECMLKLAQELLLKQYQIESSEEDWAYESVTMEKEELDPETLAIELLYVLIKYRYLR